MEIFDANALAGAHLPAGLFDSPQKPWIILKTVVEPVIFRRKADQDARWLAMVIGANLV